MESSSRKASGIWLHFKAITKDLATCNHCNSNYSTKGRTTSSMRNHLKSKHPEEFKTLIENEDTAKESKKRKISPTPAIKFKQLTMESCAEKAKLWDVNCSKTKSLDKKIAEMLVMDDLPFTHVEDIGFLRLMKETSPSYPLRKRKYYRDLICENMYDSVKEKVSDAINCLKTSGGLSFTTDEWSDNESGVSLLSLTCHGISKYFKRESYVLCAEPLSERHTGEYLSEVFNEMLAKWNLCAEDVHCVMRDAGANIKKALLLSNVKNTNCSSHQLHLIVKNGLTSQKSVSDVIVKCRSIATHFNHSTMAQEELKKIQTRINSPVLSVIHDVPTRWNSTLQMLIRMKEIHESLCLYASSTSKSKIKSLTQEDCEIISNSINILQPFEDITKKICCNSSSIAEVIPLVTSLKKILSSSIETSDGISCFIETVLAEIDKRFNFAESNELYCIATFLDPRYKTKFFTSQFVADRVKNIVAEKVDKIKTASQCENEVNPSRKNKAMTMSSKSNVSDMMQAILSSSSDEENEGSPLSSGIIDQYHKEKRISTDEDPLVWWKSKEDSYPAPRPVSQEISFLPSNECRE